MKRLVLNCLLLTFFACGCATWTQGRVDACVNCLNTFEKYDRMSKQQKNNVCSRMWGWTSNAESLKQYDHCRHGVGG